MRKVAVWTAKYAIPVILLGCFLSSCRTAKMLDKEAYLLDENKVIIRQKVDNRSDLAYELSTFYLQRENEKFFLLFPREYWYLKNPPREDESGFRRFKRENIGEPPTIYSDTLTKQTAVNMQTYLHYKGYLRATVIPQRAPRGKKMKVSYYVLPGPQFTVDSIVFSSPDPSIDLLLQQSKNESNFQVGQPLDLTQFDAEKRRITSQLRNRGYAEFYQTQIGELELDTFQRNTGTNVYINVLPPYGDTLHQRYTIGRIDIYPDFGSESGAIVEETKIGGLFFHLTERGYIIDPATFRKAISLRFGENFSQRKMDETNKHLTDLGIFRFVRIKQEPDPEQPDIINLVIQLTPDNFFELSTSLELNYTNRNNALNNNLIGISLNPGARHRNLFGSAEQFTTNLSAGVELAPERIGSDQFWNTIDLRADFDLTIPQFLDYLGLWKAYNRLPDLNDKTLTGRPFYRTLKENATTHISAGYEYLLIFNWYSYDLLNLSYGYDVVPERYKRYSIDHFAVNFLNPTTQPLFEEQLKENGFIQRSFGQQVFFSLLFREFDYVVRTPVNLRGESTYLGANFELAGAEILGLNSLYNAITNQVTEWKLGPGIEFSQYAKAELDLRYQRQYTTDQAFVARFNLGAAIPFGGFTSDVPYVKQFFVGGANSMRAWAPRGLGPGGYQDPLAQDPRNSFRLFQTGDLKLEMNAEYRFPMIYRLKGAIFVDVGNVWALNEDSEERPNAQFSVASASLDNDGLWRYPFYRQIAVAGGMGFRLDLSYFILRFDVGMKLRYNQPDTRLGPNPAAESAWWNDFKDINREDFGLNFGLGFPF